MKLTFCLFAITVKSCKDNGGENDLSHLNFAEQLAAMNQHENSARVKRRERRVYLANEVSLKCRLNLNYNFEK